MEALRIIDQNDPLEAAQLQIAELTNKCAAMKARADKLAEENELLTRRALELEGEHARAEELDRKVNDLHMDIKRMERVIGCLKRENAETRVKLGKANRKAQQILGTFFRATADAQSNYDAREALRRAGVVIVILCGICLGLAMLAGFEGWVLWH